jgi:membrane-associated phospholipid phosphatase
LPKTQQKLLSLASKLLAELGDKYGIGGAIFVALVLFEPAESFMVGVAFFLSTAVWSAEKMAVAEVRPQWTTARLEEADYGFPSGHATTPTCAFLTFTCCFLRRFGWPGVVYAPVVGVMMLICASRLYSGVHSYD